MMRANKTKGARIGQWPLYVNEMAGGVVSIFGAAFDSTPVMAAGIAYTTGFCCGAFYGAVALNLEQR